jgi:hypothetical protein
MHAKILELCRSILSFMASSKFNYIDWPNCQFYHGYYTLELLLYSHGRGNSFLIPFNFFKLRHLLGYTYKQRWVYLSIRHWMQRTENKHVGQDLLRHLENFLTTDVIP